MLFFKNSSLSLPRLAPFLAPYKGRLALGVTANALARAADLAPMVLVGKVVDAVNQAVHGAPPQVSTLVLYGVLVLASFLVLAVCQSGSDYALDSMAQNVRHDLRTAVYEHLQRQDMRFFEERQSGDLLAVVSSDVDNLENFLADAVTSMIRMVVTFVGVFGVLLFLDWRLALLLFTPMPFALAVVRYFATSVRPRYREARQAVGRVSAIIGNNLRGMGVIQAFTAEADQARRVREQSAAYRDEAVGAALARAKFIPVLYAVAGLAFALLIAGGGWLTLSGHGPTLGDYATFVLMATRLVLPLFVFGMLINQFERSEASARRIMELLDLSPAIADRPGAVVLEDDPAAVSFRDVRFAYPGRPPALNGVSFTLTRGKVLGVVGPTGAGKSTLVKLLLRHLDPASGAVLIDSRPAADYTLESLRRHMGYVSQEAFLFSGTVAENIDLGSPGATREALVEAARIAGALEFIEELPQGFDTAVGESGVKLSGGQRQRISLARAVLRDPGRAGAGRGHLGRGHPHRGGHPAEPPRLRPQAHDPGRGPSALHHPPGRRDRGPGGRADRGARRPREPGGPGRRLRRIVGRAERRGRGGGRDRLEDGLAQAAPADPPGIGDEGPVLHHGLAQDVLAGHEAPEAAVVGIVAVVAHHEIGAVGHPDRSEGVARALPGGHGPWVRVDLFGGGNRAAVDEEPLVPNGDLVARQAHHPLDEILGAVLGVLEDHHVPAFQGPRGQEPLPGPGQPQAVGELVDDQVVAHVQGGLHGLRGNLEGLDDEGSDDQGQDHGPGERGDVLARQGCYRGCGSLGGRGVCEHADSGAVSRGAAERGQGLSQNTGAARRTPSSAQPAAR